MQNKRLANAKRPCDCSVLYLCPKSSLCSCPHCILDITSFGSADSVRCTSNNGVDQFKPIFQVEGNIFRPIYYLIISYLIDCCTTLPVEVITQQNFVADFIRLKLDFIQKKLKNWSFEPPLTSNRHHLSYDDCLENKGRLQDCSCSIGCYHCIQCYAHIL